MAVLANLIVRLSADTGSLTKALYDTEKNLGALARNVQHTGAVLSKNISLPLAAMGASAFLLTKSVTAQGDQFAKLSQKTGIGVESLSAYKHAADLAGTSVEGLGMGLKSLAGKLVDTANAQRESLAIMKNVQELRARIAKMEAGPAGLLIGIRHHIAILGDDFFYSLEMSFNICVVLCAFPTQKTRVVFRPLKKESRAFRKVA